ncbi:MAG: 4-(cytidine 5'-diphospho)-2-C-methyl-D-erythritol kinase [Thermodesulfobacteriota bacterium]
MRVLSPAKINLFLHVTGKRADGYHDLFSLMCPISLFDELVFETTSVGVSVQCNHPDIPSDDSNLAHRAATLFFETARIRAGVSITLTKNIPVAAGLGGGSSNAASVLVWLNNRFGRPFASDRLMEMGARLGADVPFFIFGRPALATGIGDHLTAYPLLPSLPVVLIHPDIHVSTRQIYKNYNLTLTNNKKISTIPSFTKTTELDFARHLKNDLEKVTCALHPEIDLAKKRLMDSGAMGALMSGSGPTVFGVFKDEKTAEHAGVSIPREKGERLFYTKLLTAGHTA